MFRSSTARSRNERLTRRPVHALQPDGIASPPEKLADKPPGALKIAKQLLRRALMPQIDAGLDEECKQFCALLRSPDAKEAFTAFLRKAKPDFSKFG